MRAAHRYPLGIFFALTACTPRPVPTPTAGVTAAPTLVATAVPTSTPDPGGHLILFLRLSGATVQVVVVNVDDGTEHVLTDPYQGSYDAPSWSPDGRWIVYTADIGAEHTLRVMDWQGKHDRALEGAGPNDGYYPVWSPDGTRLAFFAADGYIYTLGLEPDAERHRLPGDLITPSRISWAPNSRSLTIAARHDEDTAPFVARVDLDGTGMTALTDRTDADSYPVWAPDGSRIAFRCEDEDGTTQICTVGSNGSDRQKLTVGPGDSIAPVWSPDGTKIAFEAWRDGEDPTRCIHNACDLDIYIMNADGTNQTQITHNAADDYSPEWSPDGQRLAFMSLRDEPRKVEECGGLCNFEIYVMNIDGSGVRRLTYHDSLDWARLWQPFAR